MTNRKCPVCLGIGFVCENHPRIAWSEIFGCQCGAGILCKCNRGERYAATDTGSPFQVVDVSPTRH